MNPDFIAMEEKKSNRNFWIAFVLLVLIAAGATYRNLQEYNSMDKLNVEGKRILLPVDSLVQMGDRQMIFVRLNLDGQQFVVSKKVKSPLHIGDSVPVYFLPQSPEVNGIALD